MSTWRTVDQCGMIVTVDSCRSWDKSIRIYQHIDSRGETNGLSGSGARALAKILNEAADEVDGGQTCKA